MSDTIVVRLPNWLGDTVMAVPALRSLRAGHRAARIVAAGPWASLLAGQELADTLVEYPRAWSGRLRTADVVRRLAPSLALVLPNSFEAALSASYWGARRRVGFATGGRSMLLSEAVPLPSPRAHQIDEYLLLAARAGGAAVAAEPTLAPPSPGTDTRADARRLVDDARRPRAPLIGVHLGAAYGASKLWPLARVVDFCRLAQDAGLTPVLLGAPGDAPTAERVRAEVPVPTLVGRDGPALLPAVLAELDVLVSGDTGVAHLAAAVGTPVVTLFGPTDPGLSSPRGRAVTLTHPVPCAPCFYRVCPIDHPCLMGIEAPRVLAEARRVAGVGAWPGA